VIIDGPSWGGPSSCGAETWANSTGPTGLEDGQEEAALEQDHAPLHRCFAPRERTLPDGPVSSHRRRAQGPPPRLPAVS
jgi:hypothetical protein